MENRRESNDGPEAGTAGSLEDSESVSHVDASAAAVFEQRLPTVYRWAVRLLGRHDEALDVTQDVAMRWLIQCRRQVPEQALGWLRKVTLNRAMDTLRMRRAARAFTEIFPRLSMTEKAASAPMAAEELRERVAAAMQQLSPMQREVIVAKLWDGLTFGEIGCELGIATPTAKTHYLRGLAAMRNQLDPNEY
jgi:RNA polymerase sigma factor (sigma-70 family)